MEVRWKSPEFEYREKDISWYWVSIIVASLILGTAVWQRNFLFGFFIVAAEMLVLIWASHQPREFEFAITKEGFEIAGGTQYPYADIEAFGVDAEAPGAWADLRFRFRRTFRPPLHVLIPRGRAAEIQSALQARLPEAKLPASLFENLEKFFGF